MFYIYTNTHNPAFPDVPLSRKGLSPLKGRGKARGEKGSAISCAIDDNDITYHVKCRMKCNEMTDNKNER